MADGDPEDWPASPVELRTLDRSLRCAICYDIYTGPVALVCGHSFCSRCIRDSLNVRLRDGQPPACPSCRTPCDQADLRPVSHLREASSAWRAVRQLLLAQHLQRVQMQQQEPASQPQPQQQQQQQWKQKSHSCQPPRLQRQQAPVHATAGPNTRSNTDGTASGKLGRQRQQQCSGRQGSSTRTRTTVAAAAPDEDEAITISSSDTDDAESDAESDEAFTGESDGEAAAGGAVDDAADPDWLDSEDEQQQQQRKRQRAAQPWPASGVKRRLRNSTSSSNGTAAAGAAGRSASCSSPVEAVGWGCDASGDGHGAAASGDADDVEADDEFQPILQPEKRPRSSHTLSTGKQNQQQRQQRQQQHQQASGPPGKQQQQQQQLGYVACPICGLSVREAFINSHVDSCLARAGTEPAAAAVAGPQQAHPAQTITRLKKQPGAAAAAAVGRQGQAAPAPAAAAVPLPGRGAHAAAAAGGSGGGAAAKRPGKPRPVLEAPPKLCFELLKERDLKAKLTGLGLSNDGNKKACVERYTAFRNYVLSLKDSSSHMSLAQAAAEFTKQQRRIARAASQPQSLGASLAAAAAPAAPAGPGKVVAGSVVDAVGEGCDGEAAAGDNSFAVLIQQTKERMVQKRQQQQQEQLQGQQGQQQDIGKQQQLADGQQQQQQQLDISTGVDQQPGEDHQQQQQQWEPKVQQQSLLNDCNLDPDGVYTDDDGDACHGIDDGVAVYAAGGVAAQKQLLHVAAGSVMVAAGAAGAADVQAAGAAAAPPQPAGATVVPESDDEFD